MSVIGLRHLLSILDMNYLHIHTDKYTSHCVGGMDNYSDIWWITLIVIGSFFLFFFENQHTPVWMDVLDVLDVPYCTCMHVCGGGTELWIPLSLSIDESICSNSSMTPLEGESYHCKEIEYKAGRRVEYLFVP